MTSRQYWSGFLAIIIFCSYTFLWVAESKLYNEPKEAQIQTVFIQELTINEIYIQPAYSRSEEVMTSRYGFTQGDIYLLAQLLCGDGLIDGDGEYDFVWNVQNGSDYYEEMAKVLCVVMNRQRSDEFHGTVTDVVLQSGQFSPMPENTNTIPSDIAIEEVRQWCNDYDMYVESVQVIPEDHLFFSAGPNLTNITRKDW